MTNRLLTLVFLVMLVAAELEAAGPSVPPNYHDTEAAVAMINGNLDAR